MSTLGAYGLSFEVPRGWDARIARSADPDDGADRDALHETSCPFVHLATVPLPRQRGHYGGGVVELLSREDAFCAIVEFTPESAGTRLFASRGLPRALRASSFAPATLQRVIRGQLGHQSFFQDSGRAFCLYAVLGGAAARDAALPELNAILRSASIRHLEVP